MPALMTPPSTSPLLQRHLAACAGHEVPHLLELGAAFFHRDHLARNRVLEHACRVVHRAEHQVRVALAGSDQCLLDVVVDRRFLRAHEARAHVDPLRAERERRCHAAPVTDAAGSDDRNLQRTHCCRKQNQARHIVFAGMAGALETVDADDVDAVTLRRQRMAHRRALVNGLDAVLLEARRACPSGCCPRFRRS